MEAKSPNSSPMIAEVTTKKRNLDTIDMTERFGLNFKSSNALYRVRLTASLSMLSPKISAYSLEWGSMSLKAPSTETGSVAEMTLPKMKQ